MLRMRYVIEHLDKDAPIAYHHQFCRRSVWLRVDEDTIIGMVSFSSLTFLTAARDHPNIVMLPHLADTTPVRTMLDRKSQSNPVHATKFDKLKTAYGLSETHSTTDFIGLLLQAGHTQFEPDM